jgi:antirepressor regulating drug resistance, predicted signal transduction N-terminal membrane component
VLLLLPLMGAALGAFAETAYVFPEDKVTKEKPGIRIRGVKSSSGKEPLVLVDGRETVLDSIKTEQIKTITVLKDSTVVAVYGEKGRNGVILVEMKKDTEPASMYLEVKKAKVVSGKSGTVIVSDSVGTVVTAGQPEEVTVVGYGMKSKEGNVVRLRGQRRSDSRTVVYLVDGVRVPEIESLDPNRIESISVLKDASVPAEYLAEGCTGVIAITTKRTPDARQAAVESVEGSPDSSTTVYKGSVTVNGAFSEGTLILINGKEAAQADVDALKPGRIKKMTVYKGDEAVKRYGERGRNGVADIRVRK